MGQIQRALRFFHPWVLQFLFLTVISVFVILMGCGKSNPTNPEGARPPDTAPSDLSPTDGDQREVDQGELGEVIPQCPAVSGSESTPLLLPIPIEQHQKKTLLDQLRLFETQYRAYSPTGSHRLRVCFDDIGLTRFRFGPADSPFRTDIYVRPYYRIRIDLVGEHGQKAKIFYRGEEAEELSLTPNHQFTTREQLLRQIHEAKQVMPAIDRYLEHLVKREENENPIVPGSFFSLLGSAPSWNTLIHTLLQKQEERKVNLNKDETYQKYEFLLGKYRGGHPPSPGYREVRVEFDGAGNLANFRIINEGGSTDAAYLTLGGRVLITNSWGAPTGGLRGTFRWGEIGGKWVITLIDWHNDSHWSRATPEELFQRPPVSDSIGGLPKQA